MCDAINSLGLGYVQTWVWTMTRLRRRTITRRHTQHTAYTEVDMDATEVSVDGFILKLLCSGSVIMRRKTRRRWKFSTMAFCEAMAATSIQRCVWMRSWSQERGAGANRDVNAFTETDFIQNFKMSRYRLHLSAPLHKTLTARHSSEATHLSEEARCSWPVLIGNRRRYVVVADPFYFFTTITAVGHVCYVDFTKASAPSSAELWWLLHHSDAKVGWIATWLQNIPCPT